MRRTETPASHPLPPLVVRSHRGIKRVLSACISNTTADCTENKIWDPKNWRHTRRELARYTLGLNSALQKTSFFTMAGPDATKIGTQLSVSAALLGDSESQKVGVAQPQTYVFVTTCEHKSFQRFTYMAI